KDFLPVHACKRRLSPRWRLHQQPGGRNHPRYTGNLEIRPTRSIESLAQPRRPAPRPSERQLLQSKREQTAITGKTALQPTNSTDVQEQFTCYGRLFSF